ncbi:hypothetical protein AVEN_71309-1, partial [Araneus ventricosus]
EENPMDGMAHSPGFISYRTLRRCLASLQAPQHPRNFKLLIHDHTVCVLFVNLRDAVLWWYGLGYRQTDLCPRKAMHGPTALQIFDVLKCPPTSWREVLEKKEC